MTKFFVFLAFFAVSSLSQSCWNEKVIHAKKDGINIVVIPENGRHYVVINPDSNFSRDFINQNYIEVRVKGGIEPFNYLVLYFDTLTNKNLIGYSGEVLNIKLDSTYIFVKNVHHVCYDEKYFLKRSCTQFDLFSMLYGRYK